MVTRTCPHLGRRDDPSTHFNYPSEGNSCHHVRPLVPPNEDHQFEFCLSGKYRECPVFQAPAGKRMPASIQMADWVDPTSLPATIFQRFSLWQWGVLLLLGLAVLALITTFVLFAQNGFSNNPAFPASTSTLIPTQVVATPTSLPPRPTATHLPSATVIVTATPSPTPTATETPSQTPTSTATSLFTAIPPSPTQICTLPPGWVIYTVQGGDTLSSISTATGSTVFQLQQANCLGTTTQIFTGQRLFVPKLPEFPTATSTLTPSLTSTVPTETPLPTETPPPTLPPPSLTPTNTPLPPTNTLIPSTTTPPATPTEAEEPTEPPTATPAPP